jgi:hypothetical protein
MGIVLKLVEAELTVHRQISIGDNLEQQQQQNGDKRKREDDYDGIVNPIFKDGSSYI